MIASLAALVFAVSVLVDATSGAVTVTARAEPASEVLDALTRRTGLKLMVDAVAEKRRVTLDGHYPGAEAALEGIAAAARLEVVREGGLFLVRRAAPKPAAVVVEDRGGGRYIARSGDLAHPGPLFTYSIVVLRDGPEDITRRALYSGFEVRPGIKLMVAPQVKERAVRSYLEARDAYRAVLAKAGVSIDLRGDVEARNARVYVEPERNRQYCELQFTSPGEADGVELAHFVYVLEGQSQECEELVIFKVRVPAGK